MQNRSDAVYPADYQRLQQLDRSLQPQIRSVTHIEQFTSIELEFDPNGRSKAVEALERVKEAMFMGDPVPVRQPLQEAKTSITRLVESVTAPKPEWQQQKARSEGDLGAIQVIGGKSRIEKYLDRSPHFSITPSILLFSRKLCIPKIIGKSLKINGSVLNIS